MIEAPTEDQQNRQLRQVEQSVDESLLDNEFNSKHLTADELEQLLAGSLKGQRLIEVLTHLEDCSLCLEKLPPVKAETLLKAVFGEEMAVGVFDRSPKGRSEIKN